MFPFLPCSSFFFSFCFFLVFLALYRKEPVGCCSKRTGSEYQMQPCTEQVSCQGWKQHNCTVPPWAGWASPHGTHGEHHSWENTVKLPNASPALVLSTRDCTLAACSHLEQSGKSLYGHKCCVLWFLYNEVAWEPCAVTEWQRETPGLSSPGHKNDWRVSCL